MNLLGGGAQSSSESSSEPDGGGRTGSSRSGAGRSSGGRSEDVEVMVEVRSRDSGKITVSDVNGKLDHVCDRVGETM